MSLVEHSEIPSQNKTKIIRKYRKSRITREKKHYKGLRPADIKSHHEDAEIITVGTVLKTNKLASG